MPPLSFDHRLSGLLADRIVERIWERDPTLWLAGVSARDERAGSIRDRLGWLSAPQDMVRHVEPLRAFVAGARSEGLMRAYLLGMGGSSLSADVLRSFFAVASGFLDLVVLDTTDERTLIGVASSMAADRSLFLTASKSGTTVEVASMEAYFREQMASRVARPGAHFVAVTDPDTALARLAEDQRYRARFLNPADIGGRFSALSLFGLVPGALVGLDPEDLLRPARRMADACRRSTRDNPGLELGTFIGWSALSGRDKLTVILRASLSAFGLWIEQLVAESTGKDGKGVLPVVDEPPLAAEQYGDDRAFVAIETDRRPLDRAWLEALERTGHPVLRLRCDRRDLGAEFFRWEFATAVAGAMLAVNPFDEPNVQEAKDRTKQLLARLAERGALPEDTPMASADGVAAFAARFGGSDPGAVVRRALESVAPRDYVAFLSYLTPLSPVHAALGDVRRAITASTGAATTFGVGPRYLHSTGQYHKGGPDTGVFFILTGEDATATPVPGATYTFSALKRAQALGDYQALAARDRRVVRLHFDRAAETADTLRQVFDVPG